MPTLAELIVCFSDLTYRDMLARAIATLKASGDYDASTHANSGDVRPLTVEENVELLQVGAEIARHVLHPAYVHHAVCAGASWLQIAEALGKDPRDAAGAYADWANRQHRLYGESGRIGLSDEEYRAALAAAERAWSEGGVSDAP